MEWGRRKGRHFASQTQITLTFLTWGEEDAVVKEAKKEGGEEKGMEGDA
jgi:hypothetical protein